MAKMDVGALTGALAEAGVAVAMVDDDGTVSANRCAASLPDVAALAKSALGSPVIVKAGATPWEVRAIRTAGGTVVVGHDITTRTELKSRMSAADELLSFATHELKGPLHVLGMACHLIETRARRNQPVDEKNLQQLRRQVARLARLINELLDYSRSREGRIELMREPVDLVEIARATAERAEETRPSAIHFEAPSSEVVVSADRARVTEMVEQLVDNALRFTPATSLISVHVSDGVEPTVTVADQGPGIPMAAQATLFEPHVVRRGEPRPPASGLGLGLHLAREVARLHGGELEFAPVEPSGASFRLRLPR